jgi:hypothetical protein
VARQRSLVQRAINSPMLMMKLSGAIGTSTHAPARFSTCRPPGLSSVRRMVSEP